MGHPDTIEEVTRHSRDQILRGVLEGDTRTYEVRKKGEHAGRSTNIARVKKEREGVRGKIAGVAGESPASGKRLVVDDRREKKASLTAGVEEHTVCNREGKAR